MSDTKLQVPAELRYSAEKLIDQTENSFDMFFDAANKAIASTPSPATEISKTTLALAEQNMRDIFNHARKLVQASDIQEAMKLQADFLQSQFMNAGAQMKQISDQFMSAAKDASERKS